MAAGLSALVSNQHKALLENTKPIQPVSEEAQNPIKALVSKTLKDMIKKQAGLHDRVSRIYYIEFANQPRGEELHTP